MTSLRQDLLDLSPEALAALANPGFVKRAQKDVAQGTLPDIEQDADGAVTARYDDGHSATLGAGRSLREALCSCPASGLCRHRVTLVLAYQQWARATGEQTPAASLDAEAAEPWSPAAFDDAALAATLPPTVLSRAAKLAEVLPAVRLLAWQPEMPTPTAHLPTCTVRFFSRRSLAHARCDCSEGGNCVHVALAVWSFRQAERHQPGFAEQRLTLAPAVDGDAAGSVDPREEALQAGLDALAWQLWQEGSSQLPEALEWRLRQTSSLAQALGWRWVEEQIATLEQLLRAQQARSSQFHPEQLLSALTSLHARVQAARQARAQSAQGTPPAVPNGEILGLGVPGETELGHLRLVALGAEFWLASEEEGANLLFVDPDTQTVLVLARRWKREGDAVSLPKRRLLKQPLAKVAAGQILSKAARRAANGALNFYADGRHTQVMPLSLQSWDSILPPLRQSSARRLAERLRNALPDFVRPLQAAEHVHVVDINGVGDWHWDPARQILHARLCSGAGSLDEDNEDDDPLYLALPHSSAAPAAIDHLAQVLSGQFGPLRAVAGPVRLEGGLAVMRPLAVMTERCAVVLHSEPVATQDLPPSGTARQLPSSLRALHATRELLVHWLRQGLRHQRQDIDSRCASMAGTLAGSGWTQTARLLHSLPNALRRTDAALRLPAQLAGLALLVEEALRAYVESPSSPAEDGAA